MRRFIIGLSLLAAAMFASSESLAAARASQVTGDEDWTNNATWGATCGGGASGVAPIAADTVTICTGTQVYLNDTASATGIGAITIQTGASLDINSTDAATALGSLSLATDTAITVQSGGTLNVNGSVILCNTDAAGALAGACTAGKTVPMDSFLDWSMTSTSVFNLCLEDNCANGSTTLYDDVLNIDVIGFTDLDGNADNDSWMSTRWPYMNVAANWSAATDLIAVTTQVGTGTQVAPTTGKTIVECYAPRIGGDTNCYGELAGSEAACEPIDYQSILCDAGTLAYQNDLVGQVVRLTGSAGGTDTTEYQIIASREDDYQVTTTGPVTTTYDRLIVWPPLQPIDYGKGTFPATGQNSQVLWPVGAGSSNVQGGGAREFFVFRPAQITGPTGGQRIVVDAGGTFAANYALLGPLEAVATFGPKIDNSGTITGSYVWQSGVRGTNAANNFDDAALDLKDGSTTTVTHWLASHDYEDYDVAVAADTTTKASKGIEFTGSAAGGFSGSLHLLLFGNKGVSVESTATGTAHFTELTLLNGMSENAGYAVDAPSNSGAASLIIDNYFAANWPGKSSSHTPGSNTGAFSFYNCVGATAPCPQRLTLKNAIAWPNPDVVGGAGPVALFGSPDDADNFRLSNAWIHDYRAISTSATTLLNVWEAENVTCMFCKTGSSVGRVLKNSALLYHKDGTSAAATLLLKRPPTTYARDYEITGNLLYDFNGAGVAAVTFDDGTTASPGTGSTLTIRNNAFIDTQAGTPVDASNIGSGFDADPDDILVEHNLFSGYDGAMDCSATLGVTPNPPKYNLFDYGVGASAIKAYYDASCIIAANQTTWGRYNRTAYGNLALAMAASRLGVAGLANSVGPQQPAGARPTPFFTRAGMDLTLQFGGGSGGSGGGGAPCIGPSCQSSIGGQ